MSLLTRPLIMLIFIGLLVFLIWFIYKNYVLPRFSSAEEKENKRKTDFYVAYNQATYVKKNWLKYELSETILLDMPSIVDINVPEVSSFYKELNYFNTTYPKFEEITSNSPQAEKFIEDALRLKEKFDSAENKAKELDS